jgi:hypothetical protein
LATLRLERTSAYFGLDSSPKRVRDGFVFFETNPQPEFVWLTVTEGNEWREIETDAGFFPYLKPAVTGSARQPQLLLFERMVSAGFDGQLLAQAMRVDGSAVAPLAPVLSIFERATASFPTATALDGERFAIGNGHVATRDPHFILLDKDARPVSDEIQLFDTGDSPSLECFTLTGTAHGVLASAVDHAAQQLHLLELDASGARVNQAIAPMSDVRCPRVSVDPTGNYLSFQTGTTDNGPLSIVRFANNALTEVATLPSAPAHTSYAWVSGGDEPLVSILESSDGDRRVSFARLKAGALVPLAGDTFSGEVVPSADGRIFLVSSGWAEPVDPSTPAGKNFTIVEVACGAASE